MDWEARERDRHAEMMRLHGRMSKSAATSPVSTPFFQPSMGSGLGMGKRSHRVSMEEGYFSGFGGWEQQLEEREERDREMEDDEAIYVRRSRKSGSGGGAGLSVGGGVGMEQLSMHHSLAGGVDSLSHMQERDRDAHHSHSHQHRDLTYASRRHSHGAIHASHSNTRAQPYPPPSSIISRHGSSSMLDEFHHHPQHIHRENDTPSPISTDGDVPQPSSTSTLHPPTSTSTVRHDSHSPHQHHISHSHSSLSLHSATGPAPGSTYYTPSTSPFLGPLGALNIHSTQPSRAPSPIAMLPRSLSSVSMPGGALSTGMGTGLPSPVEENERERLERFGAGGKRRSVAGGEINALAHALPTPQLSSGPSSNGSSPGSYPHSIISQSGYTAGQHHRANNESSTHPWFVGINSGSVDSSRASSPPLWTPHHSSSPGHHLGGPGMHGKPGSMMNAPPPSSQAPAHHHLAHSVRLAFGMTPIHPQQQQQQSSVSGPGVPPHSSTHSPPHSMVAPSALGANGGRAWTSGVSTPTRGAFGTTSTTSTAATTTGGAPASSLSMPPSRAGSPPIKLAPLRISSPVSHGATSPKRPGFERKWSGGSGGAGGGMTSPVGDGKVNMGGGEVNEGEPMEDVRQEDVKTAVVETMTGRVALPGFSEIEAAARGAVPA